MHGRIVFLSVAFMVAGQGCANVGCRYDLRKYPTPIVFGQGTLFNADIPCAGDTFGRMVPSGYSLAQSPIASFASPTLPVSPALPTSPFVPTMPPASLLSGVPPPGVTGAPVKPAN